MKRFFKILSIILTVICILTCTVLLAGCSGCRHEDDDTPNGTYCLRFALLDDGTYAVEGYRHADMFYSPPDDIVIPSIYKEIPVTQIKASAFAGNKYVKSVEIPNGITSIGDDAFSGCIKLTRINVSDSVTSIGERAFYGCTGLTSVTIPDSVTRIGSAAFSGCYNLESITLPFVGNTIDGTRNTHFGYIFGASSCYKNSSYVPSSLKTVVITKATSLGSSAFCDCTGLTAVTIGNSVTDIGYDVFSGCTGLTSVTVSDGNAKYHSAGNCLIRTSSKTLILGCKNSVIPTDGSVTSIGSSAFSGCTGLTSVTIPDSVTRIGNNAFFGCNSLTDITYNGTTAQWESVSKGSDWNGNVDYYVIHCTDGDIANS